MWILLGRELPGNAILWLAGAGYLGQIIAIGLVPILNGIVPFLPLFILINRSNLHYPGWSIRVVRGALLIGMGTLIFLGFWTLRLTVWAPAYMSGISHKLGNIAEAKIWLANMQRMFEAQIGESGTFRDEQIPDFVAKFDAGVPPIGFWINNDEHRQVQFVWRRPLGSISLRAGFGPTDSNLEPGVWGRKWGEGLLLQISPD